MGRSIQPPRGGEGTYEREEPGEECTKTKKIGQYLTSANRIKKENRGGDEMKDCVLLITLGGSEALDVVERRVRGRSRKQNGEVAKRHSPVSFAS